MEVLKAVDATSTAFGNSPFSPWTQYRTFLSKPADYIARSKGQGATSIEFEMQFRRLQRNRPRRNLPIKSYSSASTEVDLASHQQTEVASASVQPLRQHHAIIKVHLSDQLTTGDVGVHF